MHSRSHSHSPSNKEATRNKCLTSSNRCLTSSNKEAIRNKCLTTRSKKLLGAPGLTSNKKLVFPLSFPLLRSDSPSPWATGCGDPGLGPHSTRTRKELVVLTVTPFGKMKPKNQSNKSTHESNTSRLLRCSHVQTLRHAGFFYEAPTYKFGFQIQRRV